MTDYTDLERMIGALIVAEAKGFLRLAYDPTGIRSDADTRIKVAQYLLTGHTVGLAAVEEAGDATDDIEKWISENAHKYELTDERWDSGENGWVSYNEASEAGIAQMYRDMLSAGVGKLDGGMT